MRVELMKMIMRSSVMNIETSLSSLLCLTALVSTVHAGKGQKSHVRRQLGYQGSSGSSSLPSSVVSFGSSASASVNLPGYVSNFNPGGAFVAAQNPNVFVALDQLRGREVLTANEAQGAIANAYPGTSYPTYSYIPATSFSCSQVRQFGFYADPETRCQVFRRCEANNYMFSYICPNGTLFNQITLVCDWWYNVNCPNSANWLDYSNPRIYRQDLRLFDDAYYTAGLGLGGVAGAGGDYGSSGVSGFGGNSGGYANTGAGSGGAYAGAGSASYRSAVLPFEPEAAGSEALSLKDILSQLPTITSTPRTKREA